MKKYLLLLVCFLLVLSEPVSSGNFEIKYAFMNKFDEWWFFVASDQTPNVDNIVRNMFEINGTYVIVSYDPYVVIDNITVSFDYAINNMYIEYVSVTDEYIAVAFKNVDDVVCDVIEMDNLRFEPVIYPIRSNVVSRMLLGGLELNYECSGDTLIVGVSSSVGDVFDMFMVSLLESNSIVFGRRMDLFDGVFSLKEKKASIVGYDVSDDKFTVRFDLEGYFTSKIVNFEGNLSFYSRVGDKEVRIYPYSGSSYKVLYSATMKVKPNQSVVHAELFGNSYVEVMDVPNISVFDISGIVESALVKDYRYEVEHKEIYPIIDVAIVPKKGFGDIVAGILSYHTIDFNVSGDEIIASVKLSKNNYVFKDNKFLGVSIILPTYHLTYSESDGYVVFQITGLFTGEVSPAPFSVNVSEDGRTLYLVYKLGRVPLTVKVGGNTYTFEPLRNESQKVKRNNTESGPVSGNFTNNTGVVGGGGEESQLATPPGESGGLGVIEYTYIVVGAVVVVLFGIILKKVRKPAYVKWFEEKAPNYDIVRHKKKGKYDVVLAIDTETGDAYVFVFRKGRPVKRKKYEA